MQTTHPNQFYKCVCHRMFIFLILVDILVLVIYTQTSTFSSFLSTPSRHPVKRLDNIDPMATVNLANTENALKKTAILSEKSNKNSKVWSTKKIAIVLAYMRTGSTLTSKVLAKHRMETFYQFEPARPIMMAFKKGVPLTYVNGSTVIAHEDPTMQEVVSWMTCRLEDISLNSLTDLAQKHSTHMTRFVKCSKEAYGNYTLIRQCLQREIAACQKAPLIVIKFIRLRIADMMKLLPYFPNMKILHLVRDPRGIFNSRINSIYSNAEQLQNRNNVTQHCKEVQVDIRASIRAQNLYPGRVKTVFYEDMAAFPGYTTKAMFKFIGIEFTAHMKSFIKSQTGAAENACPYCIARKDSNATATRWRRTINARYGRSLYEACERSNKYLGYLPFKNWADQKDLKLPSRKKRPPTKENIFL